MQSLQMFLRTVFYILQLVQSESPQFALGGNSNWKQLKDKRFPNLDKPMLFSTEKFPWFRVKLS